MLVIQPGHNAPSVINDVEIALINTKRLIDITLLDSDGEPVDIDETMTEGGTQSSGYLHLDVYDSSSTVIHSEDYFPVTQPDTRRISHLGTGRYGITWGAEAGETASPGAKMFAWILRQNSTEEEIFRVQLLEVYSPLVLSLLPRLRLQLDKSLKVLNPEKYCTLGYSDGQLLLYLQAGLERINQAQPYITFSVTTFPYWHGSELLIRCAVIEGLRSQYLFAVDTDIPQFSDSGHSFALTHSQTIKPMYDSMVAELKQDIQGFKLHYVGVGTVMSEYRIGYGFYQMVLSSPPGSTFRGHYSNTMGGVF